MASHSRYVVWTVVLAVSLFILAGLGSTVGAARAGTVTAPVELKVSSVNATVTVRGYVTGGGSFEVQKVANPAGAENTPGGIGIFFSVTFNGTAGGIYEWVRIEVAYDPATLPAWVSEADLLLYYWNGTGWVESENTTVDAVGNVVLANLTHLTKFAPLDIDAVAPHTDDDDDDDDDDLQDDDLVDPYDHDGDDMPDSWELDFFGTADRNGEDDHDGDGYSDKEEYLGGTDPTDSSDHPGKDDGQDYTLTLIIVVVLVGLLAVAVIAFIFLRKKPMAEEEGPVEEEEELPECQNCGAYVNDDEVNCRDCGALLDHGTKKEKPPLEKKGKGQQRAGSEKEERPAGKKGAGKKGKKGSKRA